jgi:cytochrome c-type biogenesis protein CcmH/NrfF
VPLLNSSYTRARRAGVGLVLLVLLALPAIADTDADYHEVIATIRCDCGCHPQSVEDCSCGRAAEMREEIGAMIRGTGGAGGMTADAVIARYVAEQGEQIRIAPSTAGFSLVAWLGPLIGLVLGLIAALVLVRNLARGSSHGEVLVEAPALDCGVVDADEPYRAKLRRQLDEWD